MKMHLPFLVGVVFSAGALANDRDFDRFDYSSPLRTFNESQSRRVVYIPTQFYQTEDSTICYGYKAYSSLDVLMHHWAAMPNVPESGWIVAPGNLSANEIKGWRKVMPGNVAKPAGREIAGSKENDLPPVAEQLSDAAPAVKDHHLKNERARQLAMLDEQLEREPDNAQAHFARAGMLQEMNDFSRAIAEYDKAISLDPKNAVAFYKRGLCRTATGRRDLAIADFRQANSLSQEDSRPWSLQSGEWIRQHGY